MGTATLAAMIAIPWWAIVLAVIGLAAIAVGVWALVSRSDSN
jgi:hypothetical protein